MTDIQLKHVAEDLIRTVGGEVSSVNVNGVMKVLQSVMQGCTNNWEQYIAKETDDLLAQDNMTCSCGREIRVKRARKVVLVELV